MSSIQPLNLSPGLSSRMPLAKPPENDQAFKNLLIDSIGQVNEMQQAADQSVESLFTGGDISPAEVLTAVRKADLTFKMMMQVRNKLMQAYQEVRDVRI